MSDLPLPEPTPTDQVLDIQHDTDPEQDHGAAQHIPHLGHALLFFSLALTFMLFCELVTLAAFRITTAAEAAKHPLASLLAQAVAYILTLATSFWLFPKLWRRSFTAGLSWAPRRAKQRWWLWVALGCAGSQAALYAQHFFNQAGDSAFQDLMQTPRSAWIFVLVGFLLFPLMEEVGFRGFLLPALANGYDWLSLERTPAAYDVWKRSTRNTLPALAFGAVFSSIAFALLHGPQLHWAKGAIGVLFCVSLLFSAVRVRTRSLAASTLTHLAYDGLLFAEMIYQTRGFHHLDRLL